MDATWNLTLSRRRGSCAGATVNPIKSIHKHKLVGQEQHLAQLFPGRQRLVGFRRLASVPSASCSVGDTAVWRRTKSIARLSSSGSGEPAQDAAIQPANPLGRIAGRARSGCGRGSFGTEARSRRQAGAPARAGTGCSSGRGPVAAPSSRTAGGWSRRARRSRRCGRVRRGSGGR